jgi:Fic/DOC family
MPGTFPTISNSEITIDARRQWVGYAALQRSLGTELPLRALCAVANCHIRGSVGLENGIRVYDQRYRPEGNVAGHLFFALKHETLDLLLLKRILVKLGATTVTAIITTYQGKQQARRLWFLYEWLTGEKLSLEEMSPAVRYLPLLDTEKYFTGPQRQSPRHKITNNLLGDRHFCPVVRKTEALQAFTEAKLSLQVEQVMGRTSQDVWRRAASFLLLADSRASFAIEGERPARNRIERWALIIQKAGHQPLSLSEIIEMHGKLIPDNRFVAKGLRTEGVFLGERNRDGEPVPEFIGARPEDLPSLMQGVLDSHRIMSDGSVDPVIHAALIAFGFVFMHPFEDGNGRLHRALIHHILAGRKFAPAGVIFPVSAVMLEHIEKYRQTLRDFSAPLMPSIDWQPTPTGNVEVLNDTSDLYRFGDYTALAEYLYTCVEHTITTLLPKEVHYLKCYDLALTSIGERIDMPANQIRDLIMFITQNGMKLSLRRRQKEFALLTDAEVQVLEKDVAEAFSLPEAIDE